MNRKSLLLLTAAVGQVLVAKAASAQAAPDQAGAQAIQEVVVTAEKRAVDVQKTPLAITALSRADVEEKGIRTLDDLQYNTPGLTVDNSGDIKETNIRGVGLQLISPNTSSGILNYRDGVLIVHEPALLDPYFDINDIEVLRGPQGTLVGSNSTGGAVLVTSTNPTMDRTKGYIEQTVGSYTNLRTEGAVNIPLDDKLAVRVAGNHESRNSFWTSSNPSAGAQTNVPGAIAMDSMRLSVAWKPVESLSFLLKSEVDDHRDTGVAGNPSPYSAYYAYGSHIPFVTNSDRDDSTLRQTDWRSILTTDWYFSSFAELRLTGAYSYVHNREITDGDHTAYNGQWTSFNVHFATTQYEADLISTGAGPFQWSAGAFTYHDYVKNGTFDIYSNGTPAAPTPFTTDTNISGTQYAQSYAFFGQASYKLTSNLELNGGVRWTHDKRWEFNGGVHIQPINLFIPNGPEDLYERGTTTGKVGLNWTVSDDNLIYAFAARGAKAGGYNTGGTLFGPETLWDYEAGWKGSFLDRHLRTQFDVFYEDYNGLQLSVYNPLTTQSAVANAAGAKIGGFEASLQAVLGDLSLDATAAYVHSKLGPKVLYDTRYSPALPVQLDGKPLPFAPQWTGNIGVEYNVHLGAIPGVLKPRAQLSYVDSQWATPFQEPGRDLVPSRTLFDLRLTYIPNPTWRVEAYMKNVFDNKYLEYIGANATTETWIYGEPRTFGVKLDYAF